MKGCIVIPLPIQFKIRASPVSTMSNFKINLLKKITNNNYVWQITGGGGQHYGFVVLANTPNEIKKINDYLENLNTKGMKLSLTDLEKMEKRYLLSIKQELKNHKTSNHE